MAFANPFVFGLERFLVRGLTIHRFVLPGLCLAAALSLSAQTQPATDHVVVIEVENSVEVLRAGASTWDAASPEQILYPGDQVRTDERSRALLRLANQTTLRLGELTVLRIPESRGPGRVALELLRGVLYFFRRDKPDLFEIQTGTVSAVVRGTEFMMREEAAAGTTVHLFDGELLLSNAWGRLDLWSGQSALAEPGTAPRSTAVLDPLLAVQWSLYYPAIVDPGELAWSAGDLARLREVLKAYRSGDLQAAVALWPVREAGLSDLESEAARIFQAAVLLAVGGVTEAEGLLSASGVMDSRGGTEAEFIGLALQRMIELVRAQDPGPARPPRLASEWLVESYARQSLGDLHRARAAALEATRVAPGFGFGWVRLAELEFSHGRVNQAEAALEEGIRLSPRNAQGLALRGFLAAARGWTVEAQGWFELAIRTDSALGNGWLGRGLCRIRRGDLGGGLGDLQVAATVEPRRSVLRSYWAKGLAEDGQSELARRELDRARELDPGDPTPWLYSALVQRREGRINPAIRDLEQSTRLNDNRHIFRSALLLDQDRAVRGANLAELYADAGMTDVAFREAARAVNADYANASAHRFLADSYNALRDAGQVTLRYETPWLSEYLVANLLAPVGAGSLSPSVTAQEYSRLFERDRIGFVSGTTYYSRGDWRQNAVQHGVLGSTAYAAEMTYLSENGDRPNNDFEQINLTLRIKEQLTSQDSVYFQGIYYESEGGDLTPYYDPASANVGLRVQERQAPILLAGYHREWQPGVHTLVLAGYLDDTHQVANPQQMTLFNPAPLATNLLPVALDQAYRSEFGAGTAELQQIWQRERITWVAGGRYQKGHFNSSNQHRALTESPSPIVDSLFSDYLPASQAPRSNFERGSAYGYSYWRVIEPLQIVAGISYDHLTHPRNHRYAPLAEGEHTVGQWSPKGGLIWTPTDRTVIRAAYSQSLGGVGLDQSFQLEPAQILGFTQTYRSLIPEAVTGSSAGEQFETAGISLERSFPRHTYLATAFDWRRSRVARDVGVFNLELAPLAGVVPGQARQTFDYEEWVFTASARQLIGPRLSLGILYQFSRAELESRLDQLENLAGIGATAHVGSRQAADLHQLNLFSVYNHSSGLFGRFEANWYQQRNDDPGRDLPGADFWQLNASLGYRFPRRQAEVTIGWFNLTDQDYRLNPLNFTPRLFRDRTLAIELRFSL